MNKSLFLILNLAALGLSAQVAPNEHLRADGLPAISAELGAKVARYTNVRTAALADWHPARRELLISTRFGDSAQLHAVALPMGMRRQMTFQSEPVSGLWCPDASCLLVSKGSGGDENNQYYRMDVGEGSLTLLTDGKSRNVGAVFARQGGRFAYASNRRNGKDEDLYVQGVQGVHETSAQLVYEAAGSFSPLDFSPDGKFLASEEYISAGESYLHLIEIGSKRDRLLTPRDGKPASWQGGKFSADGKFLYTITDRNGEFHELVRMNLADGSTQSLTRTIPWDVDDFDISRDGRRLAFLVNEGGHAALHLYDTKSAREIAVPAMPPGEISAIRFSPDGGELGFSLSAMSAPGDVYSVRLPAGPVTRWTESETGGVSLAGQREPERVKFKSFDGLEISAFLYGADAKFSGRHPVVISIHGGPEGQSRPHSLGRWTYLTRELGVTLIEPNVRGSTGYGKTFLARDNGLKREDSVSDIGALLEWIKTRPDLDPTRVVVMGGSYGGYMTLAALTHYSVHLRGGMDSVGISHFGTFLKNTSEYRRDLRRAEYGDERDPQLAAFFDKISPLNNTERITAPLFVIQGKNDPRVPYTEAEQMVKKVRAAGRPVWYLLADNEGHGFARKANTDFLFLAQIKFIEQFLLPVSLPSAAP